MKEGKLIENGIHGYYLTVNDKIYGVINNSDSKLQKISLKNCEVVKNGYDLDELACHEIGIDISVINHIDNKVIENDSVSTPIHEAGALGAGLYHRFKGFEIGFLKAIELLGDKKFQFTKEELVRLLVDFVGFPHPHNEPRGSISERYVQSLQQTEWDCTFNPDEKDSEGCLILKRKI